LSAYYNEIEPYAAQWLRNLIILSIQDPQVGSAFDPIDSGMLGKAPIPFPATYNFWMSATPQIFDE
jgi:hypothetical protein